MTELEKLKKLIKAFETRQEKYADLGATDTEPDWQFQNVLRTTILGGVAKMPETARDWELYSREAGAGRAARSLTAAAKKVVEHIRSVPLRNIEPVTTYLRDYCWRAPWAIAISGRGDNVESRGPRN